MLTFNLHVHTWRSACAKPEMLLDAINAAARTARLEFVGLADHIDEFAHNQRPMLNMEDLSTRSWDVEFLVGCEATVLSPTRMAVTDEVAQQLDYVMVSANHYHLSSVENPDARDPSAYAEHYLKMLEGVIDWGHADIVAHPFFHTKLRRVLNPLDVLGQYDWDRIEEVVTRAAGAGIAFEIKPGFIRTAPEFFTELLDICRAVGAKISLGTDAHRLIEIGFPEGFEQELRSAGVRSRDLLDPRDLTA